MLEVRFYETVEDSLLSFAVIISRYQGKWVFCKHRERDTYECPGGRREPGEDILETAKRELWEETGATRYSLEDYGVYSVKRGNTETFGLLCYAEIYEFGPLPASEIEKVELLETLPINWTYPEIQPLLLQRIIGMAGIC
jgi:8-oxo-dGTP diphosphatase